MVCGWFSVVAEGVFLAVARLGFVCYGSLWLGC